MVPPEGKEQIRVKMPKGSQDRRQCLRSEGPLCAILVSVSVVGRGVGSGFPPPFRGPVPPAHFSLLHETAMLGKSPMHWLVLEKQITV